MAQEKPKLIELTLSDGFNVYVAQRTYTNGDRVMYEHIETQFNARASGNSTKFFIAYEDQALTSPTYVHVDRIIRFKAIGDID